MRVLVVAEGLDLPEIHVIQGVAAKGIAIEVALDPAKGAFETLKSAGITMHALPLRSRIDIPAIIHLRRLLSQNQYDVVHCLRNNRPLSNFLLAVGKNPAKCIAYRGTVGHLSRWDPGSRMTYLNPRVDRLVCVSDAVRRYLLTRGVPEKKLVTIYKGHNPVWYETGATENVSSFGIPPNTFVVMCIANMRPVKGVDILIEAMRYLPSDGTIHLLLIGEVRDRKIRRLASSPEFSKIVHCAGYQKNASRFIKSGHIFVMPSLEREGLPRAVIEAMAQRIPVIVSAVGGMPELVADGTCGYVVPPADPRALADAIRKLASDAQLRQRMGNAAYERIATTFSIQRTVERTLDLYHEVTSGMGEI